jgi:hypothetical protein
MANTDYGKMMSQFGRHWRQDQAGLEDIMGKVAYHESKGKNVSQEGGGPGQGLFQYEKTFKDKKGNYAQAGGMTARNRLANWYTSPEEAGGFGGTEIPDWLIQEGMGDPSIGFDASQLSEEQQRMMFLADKRYDETASLTKEATSDLGNWWAKEHWKGGEEGSDVYNERLGSFNKDLEVYQNENQVASVMNDYNKVNDAFQY